MIALRKLAKKADGTGPFLVLNNFVNFKATKKAER